MVGAVTVLARAVRVVSRGARGLERNPDEFRRPQRSTESGAGMQQAGGAAAGPVGPGLGPGWGRARAGAGPGLFSALELWSLTHCDQIPASLNLPVMSTSCEWTALGDDQEAS